MIFRDQNGGVGGEHRKYESVDLLIAENKYLGDIWMIRGRIRNEVISPTCQRTFSSRRSNRGIHHSAIAERAIMP